MSVRIDKFIWCVRLAKTRSIATEQVKKGKIKLNDSSIKPSKTVEVGDVIGVVKHTAIFSYQIKEILERRIGAKLVDHYIIDITPQEELEKYKVYQLAQQSYRKNGTGKPTKKERRSLDDFLNK